MAEHIVSSVPFTPPISDAEIASLPYAHRFYLKAMPATGATVSFTAADRFDEYMPDAMPLESTVDSTERTMLSGDKQRGKRTVGHDSQTVRVEVFMGTPRHTLLAARAFDDEGGGAERGKPLVFYRGFPDGRAKVGITYVERMNAEGDAEAEQFGYDTEFSFKNVRWFDGRQPGGTTP